jgi:hypothetical protein
MQTEKSADDAVFDGLFDKPADPAPTPPQPTEAPEQTDLEDAIKAVDQSRMVPLSELIQERKKFKGQISEVERRAIEAEAKARAYEQFAPRQQQPQRQPIQPPDPFTEPEKFAAFVEWRAEQQVFTDRLHRSEERARDKHGDELVEEALEAAKQAGHVERGTFVQQDPRHPWGALVKWHQEQKALAAIGPDPDAYRKKLEAEIRQQLAAEAAKTGNGTTPGAPPTRFPGTLADNTAAGPQGAHLTEGAAMGSLFDTNRKRKS